MFVARPFRDKLETLLKSALECFCAESHLGAVVGDIARHVAEQGRVCVLAVIDLDVVAAGGAVELAVAAEADVATLDVHLRSGRVQSHIQSEERVFLTHDAWSKRSSQAI